MLCPYSFRAAQTREEGSFVKRTLMAAHPTDNCEWMFKSTKLVLAANLPTSAVLGLDYASTFAVAVGYTM